MSDQPESSPLESCRSVEIGDLLISLESLVNSVRSPVDFLRLDARRENPLAQLHLSSCAKAQLASSLHLIRHAKHRLHWSLVPEPTLDQPTYMQLLRF